MLTGKARSDFEKWYWNDWLTGSDRDYYEKYEVIENSWKAEKLFLFPLIIEWLDSVGYITHTHFDIETKLWGYEVFNNKLYDKLGESTLYDENIDVCVVEMAVYQSRQKATEEAIIKANEIYNGN